ncbi:MAG: hypothetical protein FVQ83_06165 [Chloroflexi bacterium]|nr:hypothetical protein [Chloroflexota bacterium]
MSKFILHIGYAKAGSTFLQNWFQIHPQLQFTPMGIAGFSSVIDISVKAIFDAKPAPKYYVTSHESISTGMAIGNDFVNLEFIVLESQNKDKKEVRRNQARICETLHRIFPDSQVIIVTRGFESILLSSYSEYIKRGGGLDLETFLEYYRIFNVQWLDINHLINLYGEAFGEANLIVLPYELLRDNQSKFLSFLEQRLEIDHCEVDPGNPNPSLNPDELFWYTKMTKFGITPLAKLLGKKAGYALYRKYILHIVLPNRLRSFIRLPTLFLGERKVSDKIPPEHLDEYKARGTILARNPFYTDYLSDYLLDS